MPLTGTRSLADLAAQAPHIPSLDVDHWDLPKAQQLHRALSQEMKKETVEANLLGHAREEAAVTPSSTDT